MVVYKDDNTKKWYFVTRVKLANGKTVQRKRRGFKKKKDAQIAEKEFIDMHQIVKHDLTFHTLANKYMAYSEGRKKASSIYNQNNLIKSILIPYFKDYYVSKITPDHIVKFYSEIVNQYSNSYMENIRRHLSAILNFAINFYGLERNVAKIVTLPKKQEEKKTKYWELQEFNHFISYVDDIVYRGLFLLLFWGGLRKGEALALKYDHIDFEENTIFIEHNWNGKTITSVKNTHSERTIKIPKHVSKALKTIKDRHITHFKYIKSDDFIFSYNNLTKPMSLANVNLQLKKYIQLSGNPKITVHNLRHSHATMLINNNVSLYTVSRHLGHADIQTTANIYGHLYPNTETEIKKILDDIYTDNH